MPKVNNKTQRGLKVENIAEIVEPTMDKVEDSEVEKVEIETPIVDPTKDEIVPEEKQASEPAVQKVNPFAKKETKVVINQGLEKEWACQVLKTHSCSIFGNTYNLVYGTVVNLPQSVAAILTERGIIFKK